MSIVRIDSYKMEKQYTAEYYKLSDRNSNYGLHTSKRSIDFRKKYTSAWIKMLSENISKGE